MTQDPEKTLTRIEMPAILLLSECLFGAACWKVDPTLWRIAMTIPFTAASMALFFALFMAAKHKDDWT